MELLDLRNKLPDDFVLLLIGDLHIGNNAVDIELLNRYIKYVIDHPEVYVSLGGDQIEAIVPTDKRFDLDCVDGTYNKADVQAKKVVELFEPIKDRVLWILDGNHEDKIKNTLNVSAYIADKLGIKYGTTTIKADFGIFKVLDWHGRGSCNSVVDDEVQAYNNEAKSVKRKLRRICHDCEFNFMHHIHKIRRWEPKSYLRVVDDGRNIRDGYINLNVIPRIPLDNGLYYINDKDRYYASSGSVLRTYVLGHSTYSEKAGYETTDLGFVYLEVKNNKFLKLGELIL